VSREAQARICERLGAKFPGPTRRWETGRRFGVSARAHPRLYTITLGGTRHLVIFPIFLVYRSGFLSDIAISLVGSGRQAAGAEACSHAEINM
jgi:hypothetical protein